MERVIAVIRWFIAANVRLSLIVHGRLPWRFRRDFFSLYYALVVDRIGRQRPGYVLDVGCGRQSHLKKLLPSVPTLFVGVDSDVEEIRQNEDLSHLVVADASRILPFANDSIDLVTTRSFLEHLTDTDHFFKESYRVLSSGGYAIHIFPGRHAPFAVLNRILPNHLTKSLLSFLYPGIEGESGFRVYYNNCSHRSIRAVLARTGFDVERIYYRFYQATYFRAFFPAYVLFLAYDLVMWSLRAKSMASQIIVVARKTDSRSLAPGQARL